MRDAALAARVQAVLPAGYEAITGEAAAPGGRATSSSSSSTSSATSCSAFAVDRPLRGQLHHLQRLQDHGRPAHAPDRAAARRRRLRAARWCARCCSRRSSSASWRRSSGSSSASRSPRSCGPASTPSGAALPATTLQIEPRSMIVGLVVGMVVTIVAALLPGVEGEPRAADRRDARRPRSPARRGRRLVDVDRDHRRSASPSCWPACWPRSAASRSASSSSASAPCCCSSAPRCSPSTSPGRWRG